MTVTRALRRIGSVLLGLAVALLLVGLTDALVEGLFPAEFAGGEGRAPLPGWPLVLVMIVYVFAYAAAAGYLTARVAPDAPLGHAAALGVVLLLISLAFALANPYGQPLWYLLTCTALVAAGCVVGARPAAKNLRATASFVSRREVSR